jgi:hypothetical protein
MLTHDSTSGERFRKEQPAAIEPGALDIDAAPGPPAGNVAQGNFAQRARRYDVAKVRGRKTISRETWASLFYRR